MNRSHSIDDWLLTETVRLTEEGHGRLDDSAAVVVAQATAISLPARLHARALSLREAGPIKADLVRLRRLLRRLAGTLLVIGLLSGWLAARASVADRQIDILLAAATLLALPTLALVLWLVLLTLSWRQGSSGSLAGGLLLAVSDRLAPRLLKGPWARETALAGAGLLRGPFGRWFLSLLAHGFWLAYALGALLTLTVYFMIVQYDLTWGTTLLDDDSVVQLIQQLALLPTLFGMMPPAQVDWIIAGREGRLLETSRAAWAQFLLAMIVVYAMLPRLALALLSAGLAWRASRQLQLNTGLPGYLRLGADLCPAQTRVHGQAPEAEPATRRVKAKGGRGDPLLVGLELERADADWPPIIPGVDVQLLGRADTRAQRRHLLSLLADQKGRPQALIVLCSMLRTPDAGNRHFLELLAETAMVPLILIVDEAGLFKARGGQVQARQADWQMLADQLDADLIPLDLEQPDAAAIRSLYAVLGKRPIA